MVNFVYLNELSFKSLNKQQLTLFTGVAQTAMPGFCRHNGGLKNCLKHRGSASFMLERHQQAAVSQVRPFAVEEHHNGFSQYCLLRNKPPVAGIT